MNGFDGLDVDTLFTNQFSENLRLRTWYAALRIVAMRNVNRIVMAFCCGECVNHSELTNKQTACLVEAN